MKKKVFKYFLISIYVIMAAFCFYSFHDWYWTAYSLIHPDVARMYEKKFEQYTDADLYKILNERVSPRTDAAGYLLNMREKRTHVDNQ